MSTTKRAILIIDPQNDFCDPDNGALGVPGADKDCERMSEIIRYTRVEDIFVTMDTHYVVDISHPKFWADEYGMEPDPMTVVKLGENGQFQRFKPRFNEYWVKQYLERLENEGKYDHVIWPEHCIHGSWGHMIDDKVMEALREWSSNSRKNFHVIEKGQNMLTEHFGAFEAQIVDVNDERTMFNSKLYEQLNRFDEVHVIGEAETHCVAYTLDQLVGTDLAEKLVVHRSDAMSPVPGFEEMAEPVYKRIKESGAIIK